MAARSSNRLNWDPTKHYQDPKVAENYDRERFDSVAGRVYKALERTSLLRAFGRMSPGETILDLPCGTGRLAEVLLEAGYRVIGADISDAMLDVARRRLARFGEAFTTRIVDAFAVDKVNPVAPAVLCARVLMHFPLEDQIRFVRGASAFSSKYVVITHSLSTPYQRARRAVKRLLGHQRPAAYPITNRELERLLRETGLREVARYRPMPAVSEAIIVVATK